MSVRVYLAMSLDGFVAGPDDDLAWLTELPDDGRPNTGLKFPEFLAGCGSMLMGRRTYDVVQAMGIWPYGELPVLVATRRELRPERPTVRAVRGEIGALLDEARRVAGDRDVYLDGPDLIRQAMAIDAVDAWVLTVAPVVLGGGVSLFGGVERPHPVVFEAHHDYGPLVQLVARRSR